MIDKMCRNKIMDISIHNSSSNLTLNMWHHFDIYYQRMGSLKNVNENAKFKYLSQKIRNISFFK